MSIKTERLVEQIEVLAGTRNKERSRAAVRVEDLDLIAKYAHRLQSSTVSAAPNAAQHNALVKDIHAIHELLLAVSKALLSRGGMA